MRSSILNCSKILSELDLRETFTCVSVLRLSIEPRRPEPSPPSPDLNWHSGTISRKWHKHCDKDSALKVRLRQISIYSFFFPIQTGCQKRTRIFAQWIQNTSGGSLKCDLGIFYKSISVQMLRSFVARAMQRNNIKASVEETHQSGCADCLLLPVGGYRGQRR